jgi:metallo-beta-lactamase family protein
MVDCGLFQGVKQLRLRNWTPLPVAPEQIDAVVLTHAHLDHSGYLPLLAKEGFTGKIHATPATRDLCKHPAARQWTYLQEEDAEFANRHGFSANMRQRWPCTPGKDALDALLKQIKPTAFGKAFSPIPGWKRRRSRAPGIFWAPPACCSRWLAGASCSLAIWADPTTCS